MKLNAAIPHAIGVDQIGVRDASPSAGRSTRASVSEGARNKIAAERASGTASIPVVNRRDSPRTVKSTKGLQTIAPTPQKKFRNVNAAAEFSGSRSSVSTLIAGRV